MAESEADFMLGRRYDGQSCSAASTLEIVGERWSLLIMRDAMFAGKTRFTDFQRGLGIASNILAKRLAEFVDAGLLELTPGDSGGHAEYVLTAKGLDLKPVIIALTEWGDRWTAPDGRPVIHEHENCGGEVVLTLECTRCSENPPAAVIRARPVPRLRDGRYGSNARES